MVEERTPLSRSRRRPGARVARAAAILSAALLMAACATRTDLTPAPGARTRAPETAVSGVSGVRMVVEADAWTGRDMVLSHVTPVRIRVENDSSHDVRIDYDLFALVAPDGSQYGALPPYDVEGKVAEQVLVGSQTTVFRPTFRHHHFLVAPDYAPVYPGLDAYVGWRAGDPLYGRHYYQYWTHIPLPTAEMLQEALPAGVLEPGGSLEGFLYFERVRSEARDRVVFRADLKAADSGRRLGEIRIPFRVDIDPAG